MIQLTLGNDTGCKGEGAVPMIVVRLHSAYLKAEGLPADDATLVHDTETLRQSEYERDRKKETEGQKSLAEVAGGAAADMLIDGCGQKDAESGQRREEDVVMAEKDLSGVDVGVVDVDVVAVVAVSRDTSLVASLGDERNESFGTSLDASKDVSLDLLPCQQRGEDIVMMVGEELLEQDPCDHPLEHLPAPLAGHSVQGAAPETLQMAGGASGGADGTDTEREGRGEGKGIEEKKDGERIHGEMRADSLLHDDLLAKGDAEEEAPLHLPVNVPDDSSSTTSRPNTCSARQSVAAAGVETQTFPIPLPATSQEGMATVRGEGGAGVGAHLKLMETRRAHQALICQYRCLLPNFEAAASKSDYDVLNVALSLVTQLAALVSACKQALNSKYQATLLMQKEHKGIESAPLQAQCQAAVRAADHIAAIQTKSVDFRVVRGKYEAVLQQEMQVHVVDTSHADDMFELDHNMQADLRSLLGKVLACCKAAFV